MYYFIGIKGSGMASLARILYDLGYEVAGSDIDKYIFLEDGLRERHIPIYSFNKDNIKDGMDVIVGNAFDRSNEEVAAAEDNPNVTSLWMIILLSVLQVHMVRLLLQVWLIIYLKTMIRQMY